MTVETRERLTLLFKSEHSEQSEANLHSRVFGAVDCSRVFTAGDYVIQAEAIGRIHAQRKRKQRKRRKETKMSETIDRKARKRLNGNETRSAEF